MITGEAAHSFYAALHYLAVAAVLGAVQGYRRGWRAGLLMAVSLSMFLIGGKQANQRLETSLPQGHRWVVPAGAPYRLANLHAHTQASGGDLMPEDVLQWHIDRGFSVVAITDSNKVYGAIRAQSEAARLKLPVVVVPGEEYRGKTHLLMLNLKTAIRADRVELPEAIRQAHEQGALVIAAHSWTGSYTTSELLQCGVNGFEVTNGGTRADADVLDACRNGKLAELGDLDFRGGYSSRTVTVLPLDADTPEKVQAALQRGECAAIYSPEWVEPTRFSWLVRVEAKLPEYYRAGGHLLLPGIIFWIVLCFLVAKGLRRASPQPLEKAEQNRALIEAVLGGALLAALTLWSVWWKFKSEWFPRVEYPMVMWTLLCGRHAYLNWRMNVRGGSSRGEAQPPSRPTL